MHTGGDVLHGHQHVDLEVGRLHLSIRRGGIETVAQVVVLGGGVLLQLAAGHVMVGEQEAVGADKGARSAVVEADAGKPEVIEPGLGGGKAVLGLEQLQRRVIEGPHAFFGLNHGRGGQEKGDRQQNGAKIMSEHWGPHGLKG